MTFRKLRLLMSKYGFSILFMGFELWASFAAFFWLNRWFPHWLSVAVIGLLYVTTILAIVNRNTPPENKVTWLLIAVIPVFGSLLYLMFGERRLSKKEMIQLENMESMKFREDNSHQLRKELKQESKAVYGLVKSILSMDHNADLYNGTASTFYPLGEEMYAQLLEDLRAAKKFIFIEFYIIDEGLMWNSILEILEQKVKEGVEVKLLYDDIGCMATLAGNYTKRLRKMGIDAHKFNKVIPRLTVAYNNRDHRKILVIDGQIGYTGGVNLADEYINRGEIEDFDRYHIENKAVEGEGLYIPYGSGPKPIYKSQVGKTVYQNMINQATDYVYITTPYLIIDYDLTEDIRNAALRGVDVRIVTPHIPDKKLIQIVTRGAYLDLMDAGVKIYEYTPGFVHSKQVLADDEMAVVGSINFDYRSLVHHYENAVWMYRTPALKKIREDFDHIFEVSQEITEDTFRFTWHQSLIKEIMQLFAPML